MHLFNAFFYIYQICISYVLPKIHCSDRHLAPSGFLPLYSPMQMPACRTLLHTEPPHSWMSSVRLWQGGCDSDDTNMSGSSLNRSCWCSPAERCCCNRQICEKQDRELAICAILTTTKSNDRIWCNLAI